MKKRLKILFNWYEKNMAKLLLIVVVYIAALRLLQIPYVNLIASFLSFIPLLVSWILFLVLFKIRKENFLIAGLLSLIVSLPFVFFRIEFMGEFLGNISYFLLLTYVIFSLKEYFWNK